MANDLFAALNVNRLSDIIYTLEHRVNLMFKYRHDYPIWPVHDDPLDGYEESYHAPLRHVYYKSAIILIHTLRDLRKTI